MDARCMWFRLCFHRNAMKIYTVFSNSSKVCRILTNLIIEMIIFLNLIPINVILYIFICYIWLRLIESI